MTTRTPAKPAPKVSPKPADVDQADDVDEQLVDDQADEPAPAESKAERRARLEAELAELTRNDAGVVEAKPTHTLLLANGETVDTVNPGATHHAVVEGGPAYPVIGRFELSRGEA